ncbi:MAG TPA: hypothetical protein VH682_12405 [Gemmataceae bacterium]|jgi:transposase-like protein
MARTVSDRVKLLHGPYKAPRLRRGDRSFCLFKDCDVVVTSWTDARISWPRCRPIDVPRSHPSLLVNEELARAIRHESAAAIRFWWGVSAGVVHRWRRALEVTRTSNEGSQRLICAAAELGAEQQRGKRLTPEEVERRRLTARDLGLGRYLQTGYHGPWWTKDEVALLGHLPDEEVARRTGRSVNAVRQKRETLGRSRPNG